MIAVLPHSELIGELELVEVYESVDGPKLFVARNTTGQMYLCLWVGYHEAGERFWLIAITPDRFVAIRSGAVTLAFAFSRPEAGFFYRCHIAFETGATTTEVLLAEQIDQNLLPDAKERLNLPTNTLSRRLDAADLARKAVAFQREVVGLHLHFPDSFREEAPVKGLGKLLLSMQEMIDALGQGIASEPTLRGAISPEILAATEARLIQAAGGSFGLEISAVRQADLFGNSLAGEAISKMVRLIELGNDIEALREMLLQIKPRAVGKYRDFLTTLVEYETAFAIQQASPQPERNRTVAMDVGTAAGALLTVERITSEVGEMIEGIGVFVGVELLRKAFTVQLGERTFRGKILDRALDIAAHVTLNVAYYLSLRETIEVTSSGEERLKYELESILTLEEYRERTES